MTIINDIRACLDTHLSGTVGIPAIARQNVPYEPTTGTSFIKADLVPTSRRPAVRGLNPQQRYDGLYSILICTPEGMGPGAGYDLADLLLDRFNATTDIGYTIPIDAILLENGDNLLLENGGSLLQEISESPVGGPVIVSIDYSEVRTSFLDSPFYCTPVTIAWYIYS
jgi:hypothetical protein